MFNIFKKKETAKDNNHPSIMSIACLLIHLAKIDENYTDKEKPINLSKYSKLVHNFSKKLKVSSIHMSPTSKENKDNFDYVTKEFTKGDWSGFLKDLQKNEKTGQLKIFDTFELRPFQKWIKDRCEVFDMDMINVILDKSGMGGKSLFIEWLCYNNEGFQVPPYRDLEKMMGFIFSFKPYKNYFIDMPRGLKDSNLADFMAGVESIKNGFIYDGRYGGKYRYQTRPNVFLFCNDCPPVHLLTKRRWHIMALDKKFKLKKFLIKKVMKNNVHHLDDD